jgi:hypothetical protein
MTARSGLYDPDLFRTQTEQNTYAYFARILCLKSSLNILCNLVEHQI